MTLLAILMLLLPIPRLEAKFPSRTEIAWGKILSKTISFSILLTSFANFRFFGPLFCFSSIEGKILRDPSENRIGQADTFRLRGAGQRVRQDADRPEGEKIKAERQTPTLHTADGRAEATIRRRG